MTGARRRAPPDPTRPGSPASGDRSRSSWSSSTGSGSAATRTATRSPPPRCPPGEGCSPARRTRSCGPRRMPSACRRVRWAIPRSATSTSAPASRSSRTCPGSTQRSPTARSSGVRRCLAACERAARPGGRLHLVSLIGPGGVHANDRHLVALVELAARTRRARGPDPCAPRRPGHAAAVGPRVRRRPRGPAGRGPSGRPDRDRRRPLLRDGPRSTLGARRARLHGDRPRGGGAGPERDRGDRGRLRPRRERRVRQRRPSSTVSTAGSATAIPSSTRTSGPTGPGS